MAISKKDHVPFPKGRFVELKAGRRVQWGNKAFEIVNLDENNVWLIGEMDNHPTVSREHFEQLARRGEIVSADSVAEPPGVLSWATIQNNAKPNEVKEAQRRYDLLIPYYRHEPLTEYVPARTLERWSSNYRRAELLYGCGLIGLIPRWARRGNRVTQRVAHPVLKLMNELIENDYERDTQSKMFVVYGKLRLACTAIGERPPSYMTFVRHIRKRPLYLQELKRKGSKAAYDSEPFYFFLEKDTPRHGDRPFEICHIDHTLLNIELIDPITGQNFGRPWATFIVDAFTRRILVAYLTFEPPSYRTCMMVLRDCVRRFGRLPQIIVVDGGSNFSSTYFEFFAAAFEITIKRRPKAKARFGSVIENLFDVTQDQFVYNLTGNTQLTQKNVRQLTPSNNPRRLAVWSLGPLYEQLCEWAYNRYDTAEHGTLKQSPRSLYASTIRLTGERKHRFITYDEAFRVQTLPTTKKGTAKNIQDRGVKINYEYYWNTVLEERDLLEKQLPVKYDPYDYSVAWVYARKEWVKCLSQDHYQLKGLTEAELRIRSAEKGIRGTAFSRRLNERSEQRARGAIEDQKRETELSKNLALLRGRQREDAGIRRVINGAMAEQLNEEQSAYVSKAAGHQTDGTDSSARFPSLAADEIRTLEDYF
jgi:putative transposase